MTWASDHFGARLFDAGGSLFTVQEATGEKADLPRPTPARVQRPGIPVGGADSGTVPVCTLDHFVVGCRLWSA
eukprot:5460473-Pyramimonas_sp.AAC.1